MEHVYIKGIGSYVPDCILTNEDLESIVDTTNEWIVTRTGINSRHVCIETEATSDLCVEAANCAIQNANIKVCDIDLIVIATITPDYQFPSTACIVQKKLGLADIPCMDISAACSGFIYALDLAKNYLSANKAMKHVLVIGAEKLTSIVDWEDRSTCVLFGDGAGAAILARSSEEGIIDTLIGADGNCAELLYCPAGGSANPATIETVNNRDHFIKMQGREVFKEAITRMVAAVEDILLHNNLTIDDIDCVIPHQANNRIITAIAERLNIPEEKLFVNVDSKGNTSAASIPLALDEAVKSGKVESGNLVLLVAFGAGMTWGSALIRWQ
jgi:3-oxoacyl-[acyl-carrier-protein] synthase-3